MILREITSSVFEILSDSHFQYLTYNAHAIIINFQVDMNASLYFECGLSCRRGTEAATIDIESVQLFICLLSASNHRSNQMESILLCVGFLIDTLQCVEKNL